MVRVLLEKLTMVPARGLQESPALHFAPDVRDHEIIDLLVDKEPGWYW